MYGKLKRPRNAFAVGIRSIVDRKREAEHPRVQQRCTAHIRFSPKRGPKSVDPHAVAKRGQEYRIASVEGVTPKTTTPAPVNEFALRDSLTALAKRHSATSN
jgi:hypothetical protein